MNYLTLQSNLSTIQKARQLILAPYTTGDKLPDETVSVIDQLAQISYSYSSQMEKLLVPAVAPILEQYNTGLLSCAEMLNAMLSIHLSALDTLDVSSTRLPEPNRIVQSVDSKGAITYIRHNGSDWYLVPADWVARVGTAFTSVRATQMLNADQQRLCLHWSYIKGPQYAYDSVTGIIDQL